MNILEAIDRQINEIQQNQQVISDYLFSLQNDNLFKVIIETTTHSSSKEE